MCRRLWHNPMISQKGTETENLACSATAGMKIALGIIQLRFNYFPAFSLGTWYTVYTFPERLRREIPRLLVHSLLSSFLCCGVSSLRRPGNISRSTAISDGSPGSTPRWDQARSEKGHVVLGRPLGRSLDVANRSCLPNLSWDILDTWSHQCSWDFLIRRRRASTFIPLRIYRPCIHPCHPFWVWWCHHFGGLQEHQATWHTRFSQRILDSRLWVSSPIPPTYTGRGKIFHASPFVQWRNRGILRRNFFLS